MSDIRGERGIPLREVPNHLPQRRGKKIHYSTVYRWAMKGTRGRKLESTMIGGIRYTTMEALERFFADSPERIDSRNGTAIDDFLRSEGL